MKVFYKFFLQSSIHRKLMIMVMSITFITLIITCAGFIAYDIRSIKTTTVQELHLVGEVLGKRIAPLLSFLKDDQKAQNIIEDLSSKESVLLSCVYMKEGEVLATYLKKGESRQCPTVTPELGYKFGRGFVSVHQSIRSLDGSVVGSIYTISDLREFDKRLSELSVGMAILITLSMFVAYLITKSIRKVITKPVMSLADAAIAVTHKDDYSARAKHFNDDELGELALAFNKMMDEVEGSRKNLEAKVVARTKKISQQKEALKTANVKLEEEKERAEAANRAKSEFLRNMSHELRTPIHGMTAFANFGLKEYKTAKRSELQKFFRRILTSNERLLHLVEDLLLVAKIENGKETFHFQKEDMQEVVKTSVKEIDLLLEEKKLQLDIEPVNFSTEAVLDKPKLIQVFINILGNAVKFSPSEKHIAISMDKTSLEKKGKDIAAISISVTDQGIGIPDDETNSIFDKFVQSSRTNDGSGGTGLGLNIASKIIYAHEGKIEAHNNEFGGATFTITIPSKLKEGSRSVRMFDFQEKDNSDER